MAIFGLFVVICSILAWIRHPKHPLTWSHLPFFFAHEWIAHKELRFFFPIALSAPVLLALCFYSDKSEQWILFSQKTWQKLKWPWKFLLLNNAIALLGLTFVPFSRTVQYYGGIYQNLAPHPETTYLYMQENGRDPFEILGSQIYFYRPDHLEVRKYKNEEDLKEQTRKAMTPFLLFYPEFELPQTTSSFFTTHCNHVFQTLPTFVKWFNFSDWLSRTNVWSLYQCHGSDGIDLRTVQQI